MARRLLCPLDRPLHAFARTACARPFRRRLRPRRRRGTTRNEWKNPLTSERRCRPAPQRGSAKAPRTWTNGGQRILSAETRIRGVNAGQSRDHKHGNENMQPTNRSLFAMSPLPWVTPIPPPKVASPTNATKRSDYSDASRRRTATAQGEPRRQDPSAESLRQPDLRWTADNALYMCARAMSAFRARNGPHQAIPDGPGARRDHLFWRNSSDPAPEQHQCRPPPPPLPRDEATKLNN